MSDSCFSHFSGLWVDFDQNYWIFTSENNNAFELKQKDGSKIGKVFYLFFCFTLFLLI